MAIDFLGALGAGSDIDTVSLVDSLVAAERAPKESIINARIEASEAQVSAYGRVLSELGKISDAFTELNDVSDFADYTVNVNGALALDGSPAYSVSATTDIEPGINEIIVTSVATKDRYGSDSGYAALTTAINGGNAFTIDITIDGVTTTVPVPDPTPEGVVEAITDADLGIDASLVDTGAASDPYTIVLAGQLGADNAFTVSTTANTGNTLSFSSVSTASNAQLVVNGISVERPSNTIDDVIDGAVMTLSSPTAGISQISVQRDRSGLETKLRSLVEIYNESSQVLRGLADPDSGDEMAGVFSGNSGYRLVVETVKKLFTDPSSTPSDNLTYMSDVGISLDRYGQLEIDEDRLTTALNDNYDEIITLFAADTENQTIYGEANRGLAGDAIQTLTDLMASDGTIVTQSNSLASKIEDYEADLEDLDRRMEQIYERYLAQFTAMETAIDEMNSIRDYLTSALENLPFNNKGNK